MKSQKLFCIALIIFTLLATSCSNQRFAHLKKVKVNQTEIVKADVNKQKISVKEPVLKVNKNLPETTKLIVATPVNKKAKAANQIKVIEPATHGSKASLKEFAAVKLINKQIKKVEKLEIAKTAVSIDGMRWMITGIILILVGIVLGVLPEVGALASAIVAIGGFIFLIGLIFYLLGIL